MKQHDFSHPSREMPLPGNVNPINRPVRAACYEWLLPQPKSRRESAAWIFSVMANVSVPFVAPYSEFGTYATKYRTVAALTNRVDCVQLTTAPSVIRPDLAKFDLSAGAPVMELNPDNVSLCGDATGNFRRAAGAPF